MDRLVVGLADAKVMKDSGTLVTYALGSCVGICLYDPVHKVAGLVHIMLPSSRYATSKENPFKFADTGIKKLIDAMCEVGAHPAFMTARIAGGARMFSEKQLSGDIGMKNVKAVRKKLAALSIPILESDVGEKAIRTINFSVDNGKVKISRMTKEGR